MAAHTPTSSTLRGWLRPARTVTSSRIVSMFDDRAGVIFDFGSGGVNSCLPRSLVGLLCGDDVGAADELRAAISLQLLCDAHDAPYVDARAADVNPATGSAAAAARRSCT